MLTHECKGNASYKHLSIKQENIDLYYKKKPRIFATVPAATLLYQLTGCSHFLKDAQNIAKACYNYFFINFIPEEGEPFKLLKKGDVWFTAVMLRGFIELYQTDHNKTYINSFNQNMDYAWEHVRDEKGLFDIDFSGRTHDDRKWLLTQAAMVEMYARLAVTK